MWKDILDFSKQGISLTRKTQQHEEDLKALRQEMKEMRQELRAITEAIQKQHYEQQLDRENAAHERQRDREGVIYELQRDREMPRTNGKSCFCAWKTRF